jgi:lipopolysaccharide transport system ATP-binding protein
MGETRNATIEVASVNLDFPLYHTSGRSLKKMLFKTVAGRIGTGRMGSDAQHRVVVQALRDISFTLRSGDRLGLIGSNGAGKTTLLRTMAGIYEPASGHVRLRGSLNALLDANPGMNPDLTGRENIMLRGLISGMNKAEIARFQHDVATFAELGDFIDLPVRIYSSGMVVRLGFAMATAIRPQVLLMDEWFLAGDADFLEKARGRMEDMVRGAEILVLSTHIPQIILKWCTRAIWMDQGRIREDGPPAEVLCHYLGPVAFEDATAPSALRL